ncbi:MAG: zinc-binding dehydrogenase [Bacteroidota bacterium]|nr:zinc-binding dehydrogenase [Candidatus Kapabacteria bacterium]MDW8220199.1 zinc-binding dehydrogenase [Bacteroidota bacterium]
MKALVLREDTEGCSASTDAVKQPQRYRVVIEDVPTPEPQYGEALVRMYAAALNHRDEWIRQGQYARIRPGVILGSDGCGIVEDVGSAADSHWLGKEVIINPSFGWGTNPHVQHRDYTILGLPRNGTFAEYCAVPVQNLYFKPSHLSSEEAAALPLAGLTAYRAVRTHAAVEADMRVLISGIGGGVAQFAAQFSRALGAEVYATSGSDTKLQVMIERLKLQGGANYRTPEWHRMLSELAGEFDCIIDGAVGDNINILLSLLRMGGRYVFYGATAGRPTSLNVQMIFWKQLRLQGSTMGNDAEFAAMLEFVAHHTLAPVVGAVYPFEEIGTAFEALSHGTHLGKLVVRFTSHLQHQNAG